MVDNHGSTPMHIAAKHGRSGIVAALLAFKKAQVDLHPKDNRGLTPLHWAAMKGHTKVLEKLLKEPNINMSIVDHNGNTALLWAAYCGKLEILKVIVEHIKENEVWKRNNDGSNILHLASKRGHGKVVRWLVTSAHPKLNLDVNAVDNNHATALHLAISEGCLDVAEALAESKFLEFDTRDEMGQSPLHRAAECGNTEALGFLLEKGSTRGSSYGHLLERRACGSNIVTRLPANSKTDMNSFSNPAAKSFANALDDNGRTPLHVAVEKGHIDFVEELVKNDCVDVNAMTDKCKMLQHRLIDTKELDVKKPSKLGKKNSKITATSKYSQTPLHIAAEAGNIEMLNALLKATNIRVNANDDHMRAPLHVAARKNLHGVAKRLLAAEGCKLNRRDCDGYTPLHIAVFGGSLDVAEQLLTQPDIDVNILDKKGNSPLHLAVEKKHLEMVKLLLKVEKTDVNVTKFNKKETTLLQQAVANNSWDIIESLLGSKAVNANFINSNNCLSLLLAAVTVGKCKIVEILLEKSPALLSVCDAHQNTLLHLAARKGHTTIVSALLVKGISVNAINKNNKTALDFAFERRNPKLHRILLHAHAVQGAIVLKDQKHSRLFPSS